MHDGYFHLCMMMLQLERSSFRVGYVKYGYPIAVTTMMLAWGLIEFPQVSQTMAYGLDILLANKSVRLGNPGESFLKQQPRAVLLWHLQCNGQYSYAESLFLHV